MCTWWVFGMIVWLWNCMGSISRTTCDTLHMDILGLWTSDSPKVKGQIHKCRAVNEGDIDWSHNIDSSWMFWLPTHAPRCQHTVPPLCRKGTLIIVANWDWRYKQNVISIHSLATPIVLILLLTRTLSSPTQRGYILLLTVDAVSTNPVSVPHKMWRRVCRQGAVNEVRISFARFWHPHQQFLHP